MILWSMGSYWSTNCSKLSKGDSFQKARFSCIPGYLYHNGKSGSYRIDIIQIWSGFWAKRRYFCSQILFLEGIFAVLDDFGVNCISQNGVHLFFNDLKRRSQLESPFLDTFFKIGPRLTICKV